MKIVIALKKDLITMKFGTLNQTNV